MNVDLEKLNTAVELLARQKTFLETIERLSKEIDHSLEPFVWSVVDLTSIDAELPEAIRSGWIFVLKKDIWSGCHYHPNSIQHMVLISGEGIAKVAGKTSRMAQFESPNSSLVDKWFVIDKGIPHEFLPENENMVVVSFHTCGATELEEVDCETGSKRVYEKKSDRRS
jgi:hypothetical protein